MSGNKQSAVVQYTQKGLLGDLNGPDIFHPLLPFFLLFKQFVLSGDITAVQLCCHVLALRLYGLSCYYLSPYGNLQGDLKLVFRNGFLQF